MGRYPQLQLQFLRGSIHVIEQSLQDLETELYMLCDYIENNISDLIRHITIHQKMQINQSTTIDITFQNNVQWLQINLPSVVNFDINRGPSSSPSY